MPEFSNLPQCSAGESKHKHTCTRAGLLYARRVSGPTYQMLFVLRIGASVSLISYHLNINHHAHTRVGIIFVYYHKITYGLLAEPNPGHGCCVHNTHKHTNTNIFPVGVNRASFYFIVRLLKHTQKQQHNFQVEKRIRLYLICLFKDVARNSRINGGLCQMSHNPQFIKKRSPILVRQDET